MNDPFVPKPENRIPEEVAHSIMSRGKALGRSEKVKDTYWTCYQCTKGNHYLGLGNTADLWPVSKEDIDLYNDRPY